MTSPRDEIRLVPRLNAWGRQVGLKAERVVMSESGRVLRRGDATLGTEALMELVHAIEDEQARIIGTRAGVHDYVLSRVALAKERTMLEGGSESDLMVELHAILVERKALPSVGGSAVPAPVPARAPGPGPRASFAWRGLGAGS